MQTKYRAVGGSAVAGRKIIHTQITDAMTPHPAARRTSFRSRLLPAGGAVAGGAAGAAGGWAGGRLGCWVGGGEVSGDMAGSSPGLDPGPDWGGSLDCTRVYGYSRAVASTRRGP